MSTVESPTLIPGGLHADARGSVAFVNDFHFAGVDRFYILRCSKVREPRGWVGHQRDRKWFIPVHGSFFVAVVRPDHWTNPQRTLHVAQYVLRSDAPAVLEVPPGHATTQVALEEGAALFVLSSGRIEDARSDDFRFPIDQWPIILD